MVLHALHKALLVGEIHRGVWPAVAHLTLEVDEAEEGRLRFGVFGD